MKFSRYQSSSWSEKIVGIFTVSLMGFLFASENDEGLKDTPLSEDLVYEIKTSNQEPAGHIILHQGSMLQGHFIHALVAPQIKSLNAEDSFNAAINALTGKEIVHQRSLLAPAALGQTRIFPAGNLISSQMIFYIIDAIAPPGFTGSEVYPERAKYMLSTYSSLIGIASMVNAQFTNHPELSITPPEMIDQKRDWEKNLRLVIDETSNFTMQKHIESLLKITEHETEPPLSKAIARSHFAESTKNEARDLQKFLQQGVSDVHEMILFPINSIGMPVLGGGNLDYPIEDSASIGIPKLIQCMQLYATQLSILQKKFPQEAELRYLKPFNITIFFYASWNPTPARAMPAMQGVLDSISDAKRIQ